MTHNGATIPEETRSPARIGQMVAWEPADRIERQVGQVTNIKRWYEGEDAQGAQVMECTRVDGGEGNFIVPVSSNYWRILHYDRISITERPAKIEALFEELATHLRDEARKMDGSLIEDDPVMDMAAKVEEMLREYSEKLA